MQENTLIVEDNFQDASKEFTETPLAIGFNCKFDLHWNRRVGLPIPNRVWDCQLAHFILTNQTKPYPSLQEVCEYYGLEGKIDKIKEYWEQGIDTPDIPRDELIEYLKVDLDQTYQVYLKQKEQFETTHKYMYRLFQMHCADLLVLAEMEWNGLLYDKGLSSKLSLEATQKLQELRTEILGDYAPLPINLGSGDHLSAFLYGGKIVEEYRVPIGVYKTGLKVGQPRFKIMENVYDFPRQFEPLPKSGLKKEGYWSTEESVLKSLKGTKERKKTLAKLDEYSKLDKLNSTYYMGIVKLMETSNWDGNWVHGQFNQVVARTGRLSSSNPNLQNFSPEAKKLFYSRYRNAT